MPIINDVEVEGCKYFWNTKEAENLELCKINFQNNYFSNGIPLAEKCKKQLNCHFKQLQRLKKENEELKRALEEIREYIINHSGQVIPSVFRPIKEMIDEVLR